MTADDLIAKIQDLPHQLQDLLEEECLRVTETIGLDNFQSIEKFDEYSVYFISKNNEIIWSIEILFDTETDEIILESKPICET